MTDESTLIMVREIAQEFSRQSDIKVEQYFKHTNDSIAQLSNSMDQMAKAVQQTAQSLTRYEEKQNASSERMERLESTIREQGKAQRVFEDKIEAKIDRMKDDCMGKVQHLENEVTKNSTAREIAKYVSGALFIAMLGGGAIFGTITGNQTVVAAPPIQPTVTTND